MSVSQIFILPTTLSKLKRENNLDYTADQIVCSNGAKQSVCNALLCLINPGDEVIIPAPFWVSYSEMVKLAGGENVIVTAGQDQDFKITAEQLEKAITPKTKAIILCSPSNPTGAIYSHDELKALADVLAKHEQIMIISDEIYEHINYVGKHESIAQFENVRDRVVIVNGVSKCYAMTGWRLGWIAAPLWVAKACIKLQGQYTSGPSSISQKAAEIAYTGDQSSVETMRQAFERRRDLVISLVKEIKGLKVSIPDGAFYVFPECNSYFGKKTPKGDVIANANDWAMYILMEGHVACLSGDAFGDKNCIRMSYATSEENIKEAFRRIKECLDAIK